MARVDDAPHYGPHDLHLVRLSAQSMPDYTDRLASLLQSCVNDDPSQSSLGFLAPLSDTDARKHWQIVQMQEVARPTPLTHLLVIMDGDRLAGTAQLGLIPKQTHDYRGEVKKLLVAPEYRGRGLSRRLMDEVERIAGDELGLEVLMLDTVTRTPARKIYLRWGWTEWGVCPDYSRAADGTKCDCAFMYKRLSTANRDDQMA